jgi:hypothetical protein
LPAGASVSSAFKDPEGYLKACYYETLLNLKLPGSWGKLNAKERAGEDTTVQRLAFTRFPGSV